MNPVTAIIAYFAAIFLGGSLIAPWIYHLMQFLAGHLPMLDDLANEPFRRYVARSWMIIGIIGIWPFMRAIGVCSLKDVGWERSATAKRELRLGLLLGFGSLAVIAMVVWLAGAREWEWGHPPARYPRHLTNALLAAVFVSILEETFFRGALYRALRKVGTFTLSVLVSSAIYAILHFFERPPQPESVHWYSGLAILGPMAKGFFNVQQLIPGFFNLMLAGAILALAFERTGRLYLSVGLHAGWIFWLKSYGFLTREVPDASTWIWGTRKLIDGWFSLIMLAVLYALVWRITRKPATPLDNPEPAGAPPA